MTNITTFHFSIIHPIFVFSPSALCHFIPPSLSFHPPLFAIIPRSLSFHPPSLPSFSSLCHPSPLFVILLLSLSSFSSLCHFIPPSLSFRTQREISPHLLLFSSAAEQLPSRHFFEIPLSVRDDKMEFRDDSENYRNVTGKFRFSSLCHFIPPLCHFERREKSLPIFSFSQAPQNNYHPAISLRSLSPFGMTEK
ncbi:hypothetical protein [Chlorobium phaeobacteroides]|uniref:hypothetical protein n=1 Tax=Chlorobium phaeobacteroides TaxID=1096 RepID=UPI001232C408|nr:hypothetical protein [Chlorobium phaeobacteroides]